MSAEPIDEKAVFNLARRIDLPETRADYLQQVYGDNPQALARVVALLEVHDREHSFLEAPPSAIVRESSPTLNQALLEKPGTQIGPYKLLQQIGEGGFGVVFMAEQMAPVRRKVALKVIKPGMDTRQVIARFDAERQALAVMDHPNIAKVLDAGATESGRPYFVMELVRGVPITQYCDENSLPVRERLELFATVCQAIQHAHTKGIIHRDIKPTNVLVTRQEGQAVVKVIDFGIAKAMGQQLTDKTLFTDFAQMIGTPLYMSPEQAELSSTDIDTRSDIYSLGVLLYELLTGSTPVSKEQLKQAAFDEVRRIIREDEPQKPSTRISSAEAAPSIAAQRHTDPAKLARLVRGELDWIVMKALEKDRNRRYETASGFARDVERYLHDEAVLACPPSAWYRFGKFARRNKAAAALVAVSGIAALAMLGLAVGLVFHRQLQTAYVSAANARDAEGEQRKKAEEATKGEADQRKKAEDALALADRIGYLHSVFLADTALRENNLELAQQRLNEAKADLRGWEWHYLNGQCHAELYSVPGVWPAFSPDGNRILAVGNEVAWVYDAWTGQQVLALRAKGLSRALFSPDGNRIATSTARMPATAFTPATPPTSGDKVVVRLYDARTGQETYSFKQAEFGCEAVFSPDGARIAVNHDDRGGVRVYDVQTGQETLSFKAPNALQSLVFSLDGRRIVTSDHDHRLRAFDAQTGKETLTSMGLTEQERRATYGRAHGVSFSPDGRFIGFFVSGAEHEGNVRVYDSQTLEETLSLKVPTGTLGVVFSPDGKRIAIAGGGRDSGVRVFDIVTGQETLALKEAGPIFGVTFSPDGTQIAAMGEDAVTRVYDARTGQETLVLKGPKGPQFLLFSPDGTRIAMWGRLDKVVRVFDARRGQETVTLKWPKKPFVLVFSPDGARIAAWGRLYDVQEYDVQVYDARTGRETFLLKDIQQPVFSPDGARIAGSSVGLRTVRVYDARTGRETLDLKRPLARGLVFSPDGTRLAGSEKYNPMTRSSEIVWVCDAQTGRETLAFKPPMNFDQLLFSPDGARLVPWGNGTVRVYDSRTGQETLALKGPDDLGYLAFSPDGARLAASNPLTLRVYDARTGQETLVLNRPGTGLSVFSTDGTRIAAVDIDAKTIRLFDAWTGKETLAVKVSTSVSVGPVFSTDGTRLLVASVLGDREGVVRVFEAPKDIRAWQAQRRQALTDSLLEWHRSQAAEYEKAGLRFAADFHLERVKAHGDKPSK